MWVCYSLLGKYDFMSNLKIINLCSGKFNFVSFYVKRIIKHIGSNNFSQIDRIILLDETSMLEQDIPESVNKIIFSGLRVFGYYFHGTKNKSPHIVLLIHEIYRGIPFPLNLTPIVVIGLTRTIIPALGFHLLDKKYVINKEEKISEKRKERIIKRFTNIILKRMLKRNFFKFLNFCLREISSWYFAFAKADYKLNDFIRARENFYTSWQLDPKNKEAGEWYWYLKGLTK